MIVAIAIGVSGCNKWSRHADKSVQVPPGLLASQTARDRGRKLFMAHCAICHGEGGAGDGPRSAGMIPAPANLTKPPWAEDSSASTIYRSIRYGVAGTAMPSWTILSTEQTWDLVAYIHSLGTP